MLFQDTPYSKKNFKKVNSFIPTFLFYFELKKKKWRSDQNKSQVLQISLAKNISFSFKHKSY